jgi:hypothetical protein
VRILTLIFILISTFGWMSCANIMTPSGGEKDVKAPSILSRNIKDSSLNFKGGKLIFEFDEFIQLKDVQNQLLISPLMKVKPTVNVHKRKLFIDFPDSLLELNTTYRISLGDAVQDLHEGNPLPNLTTTFSTGSYFDSLSLHGNVFDAQTGLPDTSVLIFLYPANLPDSCFSIQKPMYIQKTNNGSFNFANLPPRSFHLVALQDVNQNLMYDVPSEKIAFFEQPVNPNDTLTKLAIYTFRKAENKDTSLFKRNKNNIQPDTKNKKLSFTTNIDTSKKTVRTFGLKDSIIITSSTKISNFDVTKIRLYQNEILDATANIYLDSTKIKLIITTEWAAETNYRLQLIKGFIKDSSGSKADSALLNFKTKRLTDYGFATIITLKNEMNWLELMKDNQVIARKQASDTLVKFEMLNPGNYTLRILHDRNGNGKWDTGNFKTKQMPEIVEQLNQDLLIKANWENKINLNKPSKRR